MPMLKISQDQQRYEIVQIEQHISNMADLEIVEIEKQKLARLIYFAKKSLQKSAPNSIDKQYSGEVDWAMPQNDSR